MSGAPTLPAPIWGPAQLTGSLALNFPQGFSSLDDPKSTTDVGQQRSGGGQAGSFREVEYSGDLPHAVIELLHKMMREREGSSGHAEGEEPDREDKSSSRLQSSSRNDLHLSLSASLTSAEV